MSVSGVFSTFHPRQAECLFTNLCPAVSVVAVDHGVEALSGVLGVDPFLDEVGVGEVGQGRPDAPL